MRVILFGLLCALAVGCNESNRPASADRSSTDGSTTGTTSRVTTGEYTADRTNTAVNARDQDGTTKTPLDQNENTADIAITADIRKQVVDTEMSIKSQNVKIITQDGKVTLRGPVETAAEKTKIEEIARAVAGANNIDSQLDVVNE
jgi:hypothetical protein